MIQITYHIGAEYDVNTSGELEPAIGGRQRVSLAESNEKKYEAINRTHASEFQESDNKVPLVGVGLYNVKVCDGGNNFA